MWLKFNVSCRQPAAIGKCRDKEKAGKDFNHMTYQEVGFNKIDEDLRFLMECYQEVLEDQGLHELARVLPWTHEGEESIANHQLANGGSTPEGSPSEELFPGRLGQVYALSFQLLNMVEENVEAQIRRARETADGMDAERGLWGYVLRRFRERGLTQEQIAREMARVRVEPVLTAHPTEAKRATVLEQHRLLYLLLFERENTIWTPAEQDELRDQIKASIERIWRTGEILLQKPDVADERRNLLHYLREVFPAVLPRIDGRLQQAWKRAGLDEEWLEHLQCIPSLQFGTWAGGDRDGHPLVTAEVTRETLNELRQSALLVMHRHLSALWESLCLSTHVQEPPPELTTAIDRLRVEVGPHSQAIIEQNLEEPWRQFVALMMSKLPVEEIGTRERVALPFTRDEPHAPARA